MAFQTNVQAPDMVSLALNLMQMKRQADLEERRMALEEAKMQAEQRAAELQARRDNIEWGLNIQKSAAELDAKRQEMGGGLAPSLGVVMDPAATGEEQRAAGSNYANSLMQRAQILAGFDENGYPNPVRGEDLNALGNIASGTLGVENAKARNTPTLDWEYRENGDKRRVIVGPGGKMTPVPGAVWVPPKSGVTVNVGGEGLDLNQIATASREQSQGIGQLNTAVTQVDQVTQANAAGAEETAAQAEQLNAQATELTAVIGYLLQLVGGRRALDPQGLPGQSVPGLARRLDTKAPPLAPAHA